MSEQAGGVRSDAWGGAPRVRSQAGVGGKEDWECGCGCIEGGGLAHSGVGGAVTNALMTQSA